ncbi:hypothetical protein C8R45DRAFT_531743 [Mycena sanguinolenta]|nr:hypothetical protein C8R45DRAFT_531743 [Mycena sanguinolenta]
MHRSLQIPEVVALIGNELLPNGYDPKTPMEKETSAILAAFAITCKAFSSPALDLLWKTLSLNPSLYNLLNCLPSNVWDGLSDDAHFRVPVALSDWERVLVYSRRTRSFVMQEIHSAKSLETLRICFPGQLFPNIETLHWVMKDPLFSQIDLFFGPQLTALTIGSFSTVAHLSFLTTVAMQCPLLEDVSIIFSDELLAEFDAMENAQVLRQFRSLSCFVQALKHLRKLAAPSLDRAALEHVARLPTFVSLELTQQYPIITIIPTPANIPLVASPESSLQSLDMTGTTVAVLEQLIALLGHAPISYFKATFPKSTTSQEIVSFYARLAARCTHSSLISELDISIAENPSTEGVPPVNWVVGRDMRPLLSFCNMTGVVLSGPAGVYVNDTTVEQLARAWSRLEVLKLFPSGDARSDTALSSESIITLGGLLHLARHCPQLKILHLTLNAAAPVPQLESGNERVQQRQLKWLHVFRSSLAAQDRVAVFLSSVFPEMRRVSSGYSSQQDRLYKYWKWVNTTLPTLRMVRREEEHWSEIAVASVISSVSVDVSQDTSL